MPDAPPPDSTPRPVPTPSTTLRGARFYAGFLTPEAQQDLVAELRGLVAQAPLFSPVTRSGQMSVRMTSAGRFGWVADARGYRYSTTHPSGQPWPAIPDSVLAIWRAVSGASREPGCCLINFYGEGARMGLHQDRDEADFTQPVVSISLGDDALFRIGNPTRGGRTQSLWLRSGDVLVLGEAARLCYHGVDRIAPGTSTLLAQGGRINLTLRVVD